MRLVFLGTPEFAVPTLERILEAGHDVAAVYTQPDRPKGRGREPAPPPVKVAALSRALEVRQPERIRRPEVVADLARLEPDAMVVAGYGQIIPQNIIDIPRLGIINVHASLLPKYRGAAPVQWAIALGETVTGVTTMRIDAGLDTGDILLAREISIGPEEDAVQLSRRLALMGAGLLVETLERLRDGTLLPVKQDPAMATLAPILRKEDGLIDWNMNAREVYNRIRGFVPWPGAYTNFRGAGLHVWRSRMAESAAAGPPGSLAVEGRRLRVCCGGGTGLELLEVQLDGRRRCSAGDFMNGQQPRSGETLGGPGR
ncbi:MAG: methionyl-tRNA formyltransferase [Bryobacterales bacterium]|nr:methionyl-tRNA formyltransferase [Bryobacterales bacterium]